MTHFLHAWIYILTIFLYPFPVLYQKIMGLHEDEDRQYAAEVQAVQSWWKDSRWRYTKRPFTAEQIVAKRGNLKIDYPSNVQAKKLWGIVESNFQVSLVGKYGPMIR